ncbi:unnamed protein product [Adineta ricciae]|uniref:G-protein coupled receptors family 1 profile domain-containing protein n=1 Tax=Adineta ricciae TaxID=249248 RepID=A0A815HGC6_ADIRI|nr:unnamed protein product [Adineta ricciae]CAF1352048.1 unnamed protein product [Adineta ricciae]
MNYTTTILRVSRSTSDILTAMPYIVNIFIGTFLVVMGNIGCIGNVIVYRSPIFCNQAYAKYLLAETISDFFVINLVLLTRVIEKGYGIPVYTTRYDFICRIRQTGSYYFVLTSFSYYTLATLDRILSAQRSYWLRKWNNRISLAYKLIVACAIIWLLLIGHRLFIYALVHGKCNPQVAVYDQVNNYIEAIVMELGPLIIVFTLAYLLKRSLRNIIQRPTASITIGKHSRVHHIDSQITLMLLLQSIVAIISFLPYGIETLYDHITETWYKTSLQLAIEKIIGQIAHTLLYTFSASSFHISIISSHGFRREIKRILRKKMIHPLPTTPTFTAKIR